MSGDVLPAPPHHAPPPAAPPADPLDVECPVCYQEYNQFNKCPRLLECLHVFCSECLQRLQLCPLDASDPRGPLAVPCPLCRHLTPLERGGVLALPRNSRILSKLPPVAFSLPSVAASGVGSGLATVTQRVVLSLEGDGTDARFLILPTVSLRVQRMEPGGPYGAAPGRLLGRGGEEEEVMEVMEQSKRTLFCVQLLAIVFWVVFVVVCVVGVVFGPHFLNRKL